jgi:Lon protease-like protein
MPPHRIPLFPLQVVLLPGGDLPLHIFEPRYLRMVNRCLEDLSEFGVVLAMPKGMLHLGCSAAITQVLKRYADGRLDIQTSGRRPFRVSELYTDHPLTEADVEYLQDDDQPVEEAVQKELMALYAACYALVFSGSPPPLEPAQMPSAAYRVAATLPIALSRKQQLLDIRSEPERQRRLVHYLREWSEELARARRLRKRARGNGHRRN